MLRTLVVVDSELPVEGGGALDVIGFGTYLRDYPRLNEPKTRVINLCDTEKYLSSGYYCSLLAESRRHQVFPGVRTINEMRAGVCQLTAAQVGLGRKEQALWLAQVASGTVKVLMGVAEVSVLQRVVARVFRLYPAPILQLEYDPQRNEISVMRGSFSALSAAEQAWLLNLIERDHPTPRKRGRGRGYRWDLAILVNREEAVPPSNQRAIAKFASAARKLGIEATIVEADELIDINRFDALFIRETTAIDHHTYQFSCDAESSGLVVIDDPASILRCCNKVFLHDAFSYQNIPSPDTAIVDSCSDHRLDELEARFEYPMVLKMAEGSFSRGVFKVEQRAELKTGLQQLLQDSALALVQEYLYTDFDWRIGVLNGRPLYACRYYMAPRHWQIYNHNSKRNFSGGFETVATFEVPKAVLDAALRATRLVGNGLYGVDIKVCGELVYLLEVNDNPSIDHKVEDAWLGDELYSQVMTEFHRRLEMRGR